MPIILGLDPSIQKTGFCVVDTESSFDTCLKRGRLRTSGVLDGILVQRLLKQKEQIRSLLEEFSIDFVAMEAPYFGGNESEHLFALNQFIHSLFLERGTFVIAFPPSQLKSLSVPGIKKEDMDNKNVMIRQAQLYYKLLGARLNDDESDAMHAARLGKAFYKWYFDKTMSNKGLGKISPNLHKAFAGKHTYAKGVKKGIVEYKGLIYRENELFWDFKKVKERLDKRNKRVGHGSGKESRREISDKKDCKKSRKKSS